MGKRRWTVLSVAAKLCAMVGLAVILLSGCVETTASGDAGCLSYGEARLAMPRAEPVPAGAWGEWIADTDDRMTGGCRSRGLLAQ